MRISRITNGDRSSVGDFPAVGVRGWEYAVRNRTLTLIAYKSQTALLQRCARFLCQIVSARHEHDADQRNPGRIVTVRFNCPVLDRARPANLDLQELDVSNRRGQ